MQGLPQAGQRDVICKDFSEVFEMRAVGPAIIGRTSPGDRGQCRQDDQKHHTGHSGGAGRAGPGRTRIEHRVSRPFRTPVHVRGNVRPVRGRCQAVRGGRGCTTGGVGRGNRWNAGTREGWGILPGVGEKLKVDCIPACSVGCPTF